MTVTRPALPSAMMLAAMDAVSDGIVIVDKDSRIIYINDAYTRILRVERQKVLHKQISVIDRAPSSWTPCATSSPARDFP